MRMTEKEYNAFIAKKPQKPSKYRNNKASAIDPVTKEEIKFDSIKERDYYYLLKDREKRGEIIRLQRQVEIEIQPSFRLPNGKKMRAITYRADFTFYDNVISCSRVIDVKGYRTEVYKLKKKLLAYKGIYIEKV